MAQTINNGQSGAAWFFKKMASEWRNAGNELSEAIHGKPSSEAAKARQQSGKIRVRNSEEGLQELYPSGNSKPKKQAQLDTPKDAVAFSSEVHSTDKHSDDDGVAHRFAAAWG